MIRSQLATMAERRDRVSRGRPVRRAADSEMKLWEDPKSSSATREADPTVTVIWSVSLKWTPATAWRE